MPIFRANQRNIYFCHIPKSAGTSVESSLKTSGFELSFLDTHFWRMRNARWHKSSPQHILREDLDILFGKNFFDYEFAIIRDPIERFFSAFSFNQNRIGRHVSFDMFLDRLEQRVITHGDLFERQFDNHFVPASRFVSEKTEIFYLSDGLENALRQVGDYIGAKIIACSAQNKQEYNLPSFETKNKIPWLRPRFRPSPKIDDLSFTHKKRITKLYANDCKKFSAFHYLLERYPPT